MKVILDTNILISGTFWEGEAFEIMGMIEKKKIKCFLSKEILREYDNVMHSGEIIEKTREKHLAIKSATIKVMGMCELVDPKRKINAVKEDSDDNKIIECAVEARADYIVSYDKHLLNLGDLKELR